MDGWMREESIRDLAQNISGKQESEKRGKKQRAFLLEHELFKATETELSLPFEFQRALCIED